jgi:predicted secreted hydrolase
LNETVQARTRHLQDIESQLSNVADNLPAVLWRLEMDEDGVWRLRVDAGAFALNLTLAPAKPVVLQGDRGLSRKGPEPGNASYYYSFTRVQTEGTLRRRGETHAVTGLSWLDREWGTGSLAAGQVGWDWFSLQLDSGADLMYYRLRDEEGTSHPASRGTWVTRDGRSRDIGPGKIGLEPLDWWRSADGRRYPVRWRLDYPEAGLDLIVRAVLPDQHMDLAVAYWEGLVEVVDTRSGRILGHGYLEMTGY